MWKESTSHHNGRLALSISSTACISWGISVENLENMNMEYRFYRIVAIFTLKYGFTGYVDIKSALWYNKEIQMVRSGNFFG